MRRWKLGVIDDRATASVRNWADDVAAASANGLAHAETGSGGIIGVLLGVGVSMLINLLLPKLPSVVPAWGIILGVAMSMSVGLVFGIYPAWKAARLDPVEALRYE